MSEYVAYFNIFEHLDSIREDTKVLIEFDKVYVRINNEKLKLKRQAK